MHHETIWGGAFEAAEAHAREAALGLALLVNVEKVALGGQVAAKGVDELC